MSFTGIAYAWGGGSPVAPTPRTYSDGLRDAALMALAARSDADTDASDDLLKKLERYLRDMARDAELPPPPPSATFWLGEQGA